MKISNSNITHTSSFYNSKTLVMKPFDINIDLKNAKDGDTFILKGKTLVPTPPNLANNDKVKVSPSDEASYLKDKFENKHFFIKDYKIHFNPKSLKLSEIKKDDLSINEINEVEINSNLNNTFLKFENGKIINKPIEFVESHTIKLNENDTPSYLENKLGAGFKIAYNKITLSDNILRKDLINFPFNKVFKKLESESKNLSLNATTIKNKPLSHYLNSYYIKHKEKRLNDVIDNLEKKLDKNYYVETHNNFFPSDISKFYKNVLKGNAGLMFKTFINLEKIKTINLHIDYRIYKSLLNFKEKDFSLAIYFKQDRKMYFKEIKENNIKINVSHLLINNFETDITEIHVIKTSDFQDIIIDNIFLEFEG